MNEERAKRIGHNEALYRQVNERLEDVNETFGGLTNTFQVVCECADIGCTEQITISRDVYQRVRENPDYFILVPGHEAPDVEYPIDSDGNYVIVEKDAGLPKRVAEETDPRSR